MPSRDARGARAAQGLDQERARPRHPGRDGRAGAGIRLMPATRRLALPARIRTNRKHKFSFLKFLDYALGS